MAKENRNKQNSVSLPVEEEGSWLGNNMHRLMIWISVVWFTIILVYITQFFGWSNLFLMMPDEFGVFLAGVSLPLPLIWLVISFIDRERSFKQEAKFLRAYMNQLVYPEEGSAETAKAMADAIRSQVSELQEVTQLAMKQTETIKKELGGRVDDFANLVQVLDNYSTKSIVELNSGVKTLTSSFDGVTDRAFQTTKDLSGCMEQFSEVANHLQGEIDGMIKKIMPRIEEMKATANTIQNVTENASKNVLEANENMKNYSLMSEESVNRVVGNLQSQGEYLETISERAISGSQELGDKLKEIAGDVDELIKAQTVHVEDYAKSLDSNIKGIYEKFAEHGASLGSEVDKIIARANVIEESVSIQVNELRNVADEITAQLDSVEKSLKEQVSSLNSSSSSAIGDIQSVVNTFEQNADKMRNLANDIVDQAKACGSIVEDERDKMERLSSDVYDSFNNISAELATNVTNVKSTTDNVMEVFSTLGEALNTQTDKLSEVSNFAITQSKVAETSLQQQNRHINNSISKIEETKAELKREIDELAHAADVIAGEANDAVLKLKEQLEASVQMSSDVVNRTNEISNNLAKESERFVSMTEQTLEKASGFENMLAEQNDKFGYLVTQVGETSEQVAKSLSDHASLVEKTAAKSTTAFNDILSAFESQSTVLNSVAENTVGYVSDVVHALDEKAENINLLFKHQQGEFLDVFNKISDYTDKLGASLKTQMASIEESSDRVFAKMADMEDSVNKRVLNVAEVSSRSIERLGEVDEAIASRSKKLEDNIDAIFGKVSKVASDFALSLGGFSDAVKDIKVGADAATAGIVASADKLKNANNGFSQNMKGFTEQIDVQLKGFDDIANKLKEQAATLEKSFVHHKDILADVANKVSTQTRLGESSMAQQYKNMQALAAEVESRMKEISKALNGDIDGLYEKAGKLSFEVNTLGERLSKVGEEVNQSIQNSLNSIEKVHASMGECSTALVNTADMTTAKMGQVMSDYEKYLSGFNTVTAEVSTGVIEVNDLIAAQNNKMVSISKDTKALVEYFNQILQDASEKLNERADFAHKKVQGLGKELNDLSLKLEDAANMSAKYFENSGDKLRSTIMEITANAERIANDIKNSGEMFLEQSSSLSTAANDTVNKVNNAMLCVQSSINEFNVKGGEVVANTGTFNSVLQKQIELLNGEAKKANKELADIEKKYQDVKVDNFLKNATGIIETLENLAVDINAVFNGEAQEKLWAKYYDGDTEAFVRSLAKNISRKQVVAIKDEYEKNSDFRRVVTAYMTEFEKLIAKARSCEKSSLLLSVISGADIGKVYYIMARALDKIN